MPPRQEQARGLHQQVQEEVRELELVCAGGIRQLDPLVHEKQEGEDPEHHVPQLAKVQEHLEGQRGGCACAQQQEERGDGVRV